MKNISQILLASLLALSAVAFTGCKIDDNALTGFAYTEVGGSYVVTDQFDNQLVFTPEQATQLVEMGESQASEYLTAKFRADNASDYLDPLTVPTIEAETLQGDIVVSDKAKGLIATTELVPVWGKLISLSLNGLLVVGGVWLDSKRRTGNKVNQSLVQGVDTFRDILDQTEQGAAIDKKLTQVLKERQSELGTMKAVTKLLERFATPTKTPIDLS